MKLHYMIVLVLLSTALIFADDGKKDNWTQYRGVERSGISNSENLRSNWAEAPPKQLWKLPIGTGFSGILVVENTLFTMFAEDSTEFISAHNAENGEIIWKYAMGDMWIDDFGNGPRSTPIYENGNIYALSSVGELASLKANDGKVNWSVKVTEVFDAKPPRRGYSTSPIFVNDLIIAQIGANEESAVIAFDAKTGETRWKATKGQPTFNSPLLATINGVDQVIARNVFKESENSWVQSVVGINLNGEKIWETTVKGGIIAMPVFVPPNQIFMSAGDDAGCTMVTVSADENGTFSAETAWESRSMRNHFNTSVYYNGHIYGFSSSTFKSISATDGKTKWAKRGYGKGSLTIADGKCFVLSDKGVLALIDTNPEELIVYNEFQAIDGKSWTMPTIANGKIYIRNLQEVVAYDLR